MRAKEAPVGFGDEYSRRGRTMTMNAFVQVETTPTLGGADIRVTPRRGFVAMPEVDHDAGEVMIRVRKDAGPRIGQTIMVGKRHIVVAGRRWDTHGRLQLRDEDTGVWCVYDFDGRRTK